MSVVLVPADPTQPVIGPFATRDEADEFAGADAGYLVRELEAPEPSFKEDARDFFDEAGRTVSAGLASLGAFLVANFGEKDDEQKD